MLVNARCKNGIFLQFFSTDHQWTVWKFSLCIHEKNLKQKLHISVNFNAQTFTWHANKYCLNSNSLNESSWTIWDKGLNPGFNKAAWSSPCSNPPKSLCFPAVLTVFAQRTSQITYHAGLWINELDIPA